MDRSTPIYLIGAVRTQNSIGEWISTETERLVYANLKSITQSEFFSASQIGLLPDYKFTLFGPDYEGEEVIKYDGKRYSVYRVYQDGTDKVELYVQREAGTATVTTTTTTAVIVDGN